MHRKSIKELCDSSSSSWQAIPEKLLLLKLFIDVGHCKVGKEWLHTINPETAPQNQPTGGRKKKKPRKKGPAA